MKVIFLDHDGVICLATEWGGRYKKRQRAEGIKASDNAKDMPLEYRFDNFNQKAIEILNDIITQTGAEIVVSSDWKRWANCEEMGEYYESKGICKKPIAYTPNLSECNWYNAGTFVWAPRWDLEQTRAIEIRQYLIDHPEITHWVAIDDLNMGAPYTDETWGEMDREWGLKNFVLTPRSREGIKQSGIKEKILEFLL
jgi:hypothetical protein